MLYLPNANAKEIFYDYSLQLENEFDNYSKYISFIV